MTGKNNLTEYGMLGAKSIEPREIKPQTICLAMRAKEAAAAIGISERTLWELTDKGEILCVQLDYAVIYPVDSLQDWLKRRSQVKVKRPSRMKSKKDDRSISANSEK